VTARRPDRDRERRGAGRWPASGPEPLARTVGSCLLGGLVLVLVGWWQPSVALVAYLVLLGASIVVEVGGWSLADRADTALRRLGWVVLRPTYLVGTGLLELLQVG
jgi:hypothetical protein